ncbi:pupal cuticle protein 36-like [Penaeus monodon]|uniref:pupal cuticle protein 36-like n=1 Tax=Penaeus monodon TaxID=6687 RepID=UPI0018A6FCE0|nr:pupal cuticle protein 36-like [Penaeus monodon]
MVKTQSLALFITKNCINRFIHDVKYRRPGFSAGVGITSGSGISHGSGFTTGSGVSHGGASAGVSFTAGSGGLAHGSGFTSGTGAPTGTGVLTGTGSTGGLIGDRFPSFTDAIAAGCKEGEILHVDGTCVVPEVSRKVFVVDVPQQQQLSGPPPSVPPPKVDHNILFVRLPAEGLAPEPIVVPPPRQNNIVYVLNKQNEQAQRVIEVEAPPPSEPEIYFVNYDDGENPTLPGGIDLLTALGSAAETGGEVIGAVGGAGAAGGIGGVSGTEEATASLERCLGSAECRQRRDFRLRNGFLGYGEVDRR